MNMQSAYVARYIGEVTGDVYDPSSVFSLYFMDCFRDAGVPLFVAYCVQDGVKTAGLYSARSADEAKARFLADLKEDDAIRRDDAAGEGRTVGPPSDFSHLTVETEPVRHVTVAAE